MLCTVSEELIPSSASLGWAKLHRLLGSCEQWPAPAHNWAPTAAWQPVSGRSAGCPSLELPTPASPSQLWHSQSQGPVVWEHTELEGLGVRRSFGQWSLYLAFISIFTGIDFNLVHSVFPPKPLPSLQTQQNSFKSSQLQKTQHLRNPSEVS